MQEDNTAFGFGERLRDRILARFGTLKDFCERGSFAYATLQHYLRGTRRPNADLLLQLAAILDVNTHWLLTGQGESEIEPGSLEVLPDGSVVVVEAATVGMACNAPLASWTPVTGARVPDEAEALLAEVEALRAQVAALQQRTTVPRDVEQLKYNEQLKLFEEVGMGTMLLMARRAIQGEHWHMLANLQAGGSMTLDQIVERLRRQGKSVDEVDVAADLAILQKMGLVTVVDEDGLVRYKMTETAAFLQARGFEEAGWCGVESLRWLLLDLLPKAQSHQGYVGHMVAQITVTQQAGLLQRAREMLLGLMTEAEAESAAKTAVRKPFRVLLGIEMNGEPLS